MSPHRIAIRPLTHADIPQAMQLVASANWNQTPRDWQRMIDSEPEGCFKAVLEPATGAPQLVGTVTSTTYGTELAWIGMMLVAAEQRRQGIGRLLMQRVINTLHQRQVRTIKLDATPAGKPLYAQLGFQCEHDFQRWSRPAQGTSGRSPAPTTSGEFECARWAELDRAAFGVDRQAWLRRLASDCQVVERSSGFGMCRSGRVASYLGPVTATDTAAAAELIDALIADRSATWIWDVPPANPAAAVLARERGFEPVRELTRMWLGQPLEARAPQCLFALSDPATG
jgi:predicted N-acetyltransferase YhbS